MKKAVLLLVVTSIIMLTFVNPLSPSSVEAYTLKGWKFPSSYVTFKTTASRSYINNSWGKAISVWNNEQNYVSFSRTPGSRNVLSDEYTTSSSRYGVMTTYYNSSNNVTRFNGRLNRAKTDIQNNSNVRQSTGVHEIGHSLGLGHTSNYAIMNTSRTRKTLTTPTSDDRNGINAIY